MNLFLLTVLVLCLLGVFHTYLFYPWWVVRRARSRVPAKLVNRELSQLQKGNLPPWPQVYVLMAVHNEESVLLAKLNSLSTQDYPGKLSFLIGSDCSTDATNILLQQRSEEDKRFRNTLFQSRQGKPNIINQLAEQVLRAAATDQRQSSAEQIFVLTDASVLLTPATITELVRPLRADQKIGVVDATMVQTGGQAEGIGRSEEAYIDREVRIKRAEGWLWGAMIGPFGGCWAIRAEAFQPVPPAFLVDDFYLCMAAYESGYQGISSPKAIVREGVGQSIRAEFRRKVRISSGNWQNLVRFRKLWWPPYKNALAFAFFSHKVLRWWTPFFILFGALAWALLILKTGNLWATVLFVLLTAALLAGALLDYFIAPLGLHFRVLRSWRYFLAMNAALVVGFFRFLTGIKSNVWQPSQRH
ncbi:MAG: glycosyltransferase [Bacteroidota bacterium]